MQSIRLVLQLFWPFGPELNGTGRVFNNIELESEIGRFLTLEDLHGIRVIEMILILKEIVRSICTKRVQRKLNFIKGREVIKLWKC